MVPVGKILSAHGIKGEVKIFPYGETLKTRKKGDLLFLKPEDFPPLLPSPQRGIDKSWVVFTVNNLRLHNKVFIVSFAEITTRNDSEKLAGKEIFLPENLFPPTEEGEYFYYQIIGLKVKSKDGKYIGQVKSIFETQAHDIYVVQKKGKKEILIPAVSEIVVEIDLQKGLMIVDLPDGLDQ